MNPAGSEKSSIKTSPQILGWLLALVFVTRVLAALLFWKTGGPSAFLSPDSLGYVDLAKSLLHGSFSISGVPEIFRTPGYPLLLIPAVASGHFLMAALIENLLMSLAAGTLVWKIAKTLFPGSNAPVWAVVFYCFEPIGFMSSEKLLSETAFTLGILLFVWLMLRFCSSPTYGRAAACAIALAISTYIRPVSLYLGLCFAVVLLVSLRRLVWHRRISLSLTFLLVFSFLIAPWIVRNSIKAEYKGFSCAGDWGLYFFSVAAIESKLEHRSFVETQKALGHLDAYAYFHVHPEQISWSPGRVARWYGSEAHKIVAAHWLTYLPIHARGCATVMFDPYVTEILRSAKLYPQVGGLLNRLQEEGIIRSLLWLMQNYPVTALMLPLLMIQLLTYYLLGGLALRRLPAETSLILLAISLYFVVIAGFPAAVGRYRAPFIPLICICAGAELAFWLAPKDVKMNDVKMKAESTPESSIEKISIAGSERF
ncbi:MAG TPA: glycosyltransferase family 39 protein [Candidatus Angelobacter sp.]|nr:glycosyltransferase family 39 protein [Candidatus Angelobacter sp.]